MKSNFKSCPVCREQLNQCLQCGSYAVNDERIYYEKLTDFGATNDSEKRFIKRIQKHSTTAFFHNGTLYIPSRQGRSVPLAIGLQWEAWQEQQSEIDQLKKQLSDSEYLKEEHHKRRCELAKEVEKLKAEKAGVQKRFNFLLDKNICNESDHASLKLRVVGLLSKWKKDSEHADSVASEDFVQNVLDACIDDLEKALQVSAEGGL